MEAPDSFGFAAGKTMWDGKRRLVIGWIPRQECDCAPFTWGGNMLLPRELRLLSDGIPATSLPHEVLQALLESDATSGRGATIFTTAGGSWHMSRAGLAASPTAGQSALASWSDAPADFCLQADVTFGPGATLAILLRGHSDEKAFWSNKTPLDQGYEIFFNPADGTVVLHEFYQWHQRMALKTIGLDGLITGALHIEVVLHGDILEVFLDRRRSLVHRLLKHLDGALGLLASDGSVDITNMRIGRIG